MKRGGVSPLSSFIPLMARHKALIAILLILPLAGCSSAFSKLKRVEPGMTFPQVEAVMGKPDRSQSVKKESSLYVLYRYDHRLCNPDLSFYDRCDFFVVFENGHVLEKIVNSGSDSYSPRTNLLYLFEGRSDNRKAPEPAGARPKPY